MFLALWAATIPHASQVQIWYALIVQADGVDLATRLD